MVLSNVSKCLRAFQMNVTEYPCVQFGPKQYEHIYNDTLSKYDHVIKADEDTDIQKIDKVLHKMLNDAGQVLDLIILGLTRSRTAHQ